jgi:hypothetical protein
MRTVAADKPLGVDDFFAPIRVAELCLDTTSDRLEADQLDLPLDHNPKRLKVRRKKTFGIALWDHQTKVVGTCDMIKAVERQYGPAAPNGRSVGAQPATQKPRRAARAIQDFKRSAPDNEGLGGFGRVRTLIDNAHADAISSQFCRCGETDRAGADDQNLWHALPLVHTPQPIS